MSHSLDTSVAMTDVSSVVLYQLCLDTVPTLALHVGTHTYMYQRWYTYINVVHVRFRVPTHATFRLHENSRPGISIGASSDHVYSAMHIHAAHPFSHMTLVPPCTPEAACPESALAQLVTTITWEE